ncbi:MAG TPA: hypothetical protein VKQ06_01540 [Gammaproteobacteria bacterium]|nr:hypothetical protein [Gammaproteobacteria bacterium]
MKTIVVAGSLVLAWAWTSVQAQQVEVTGYAGISNQAFWREALYDDQSGGSQASLQTQLEVYWRSESDRHRISFIGFGRHDAVDDERTHADLREAYWGYEGSRWDVRLGISKVFWGVTESRHLIDVINQTDLVEDVDQEDKLGQPMLNLNLQRDFGRFEFYLLPRFRERTFPGADGRFRSPLPVNPDAAIYESSRGDRHNDYAVRYSHYFGDVDVGVYYFDGTSREPGFAVAESGNELLPSYEQMEQVGVEIQFTRDAWLLKLEAIDRKTSTDSFAAAVGGFEYTLFGVRRTVADLGLLFEYLYDDRSEAAPPTPFDDDLFIGARISLNDSNDTSILAGAVVDRQSHARFINVEAERRFRDNVTAELRLRAFSGSDAHDPLVAIAQDDYLQVAANWFF